MKKRFISLLMAVLMVVSLIPVTAMGAGTNLTNSEITAKMDELKTKFPAGKYWNHKGSTTTYAASSTPCGTDGFTCNSYGGGKQCYAFARYLANQIFGSYPANAAAYSDGYVDKNNWKLVKSAATTIEPGDIIQTKNIEHSAIVWKVDGNRIYVAECWGTKGCIIKWGDFAGYSYNRTLSGIANNNTLVGVWKHPGSSGTAPSTPPTTLSAPKNLTAKYISDTQATISWSAVSGAASYEAQYYKIGNKAYVADTSYASPRTATSYKTSGLNTHNCFRFRIRAVGSNGITSPWSEVVYVKPGKTHSYGSWVITTAATHTTSGSHYRTCTECGYKQTETIPATGHSYGTAWKSNATNHWHACSCGDVADMGKHNFGNRTTIETGCAHKPGKVSRTCTICGYTEISTMTVIGQSYTGWWKDGTNHWHECSCGEIEDRQAHTFADTVVPATSGAQGYTTHTCTVCGYSYRDQYTDKIPAAPTLKVANDAATGNIKLSWDKVNGAAKYEVYRATSKSGTYSRISTTTKTAVTNSKNVTSGKTYYYKVRALDANGKAGEYSEIKSRTCDYAQPMVSVALNADGNPKLTWDKVDGASKYEVWRATSKSGEYSKISTTSSTSVANTKNLTAGTTYYYKVRAIGSVSEAASAYSTVVNCTMPLAAPVVKVSNDAATGNIKLSWDKVNGAAKYQVYRATSKSGTYSKISTTTKTTVTNTSNVTPGKTYYYKVRALDANGKAGAYSDVKSRACNYAQPTVSVALSSGKPKLTWDKVDGASKYEVYRATSKTGTYDLLKTTTGTSLTNTSAKKGTTYYYKVRAIGSVSGATSAYSTVVSIKATK